MSTEFFKVNSLTYALFGYYKNLCIWFNMYCSTQLITISKLHSCNTAAASSHRTNFFFGNAQSLSPTANQQNLIISRRKNCAYQFVAVIKTNCLNTACLCIAEFKCRSLFYNTVCSSHEQVLCFAKVFKADRCCNFFVCIDHKQALNMRTTACL